MSKKLQIIILGLLTLLLYANTIGNRYSMDDDFVIYNNETVQKGVVGGFQEIITTHYASNEKSKYEYRPVVKLTFAAEYSIWGKNPHLSHTINLFLFVLTILLLFKILDRLFGESYPWLPFLAALLFAAHPIHTEVVASLKNRDELLAFLLCLWSAWLFIRFSDTKKWYFMPIALLVYLLGYFSKSSALVFVVLIPLILYFAGVRKIGWLVLTVVLLAAAAWLARWLPNQILSGSHRTMWAFENPLYEHRGILYRLGTGLVALLFYLRLLLVPYPLRFYYGYDVIPLTHFPDLISVLSLILHVALLVVAIRLLRKKHPLSFAILFYFIAVSMFSNILRPAVGIVAERYVYAASLGFCLAAAFGILRLFSYHNKPVVPWQRIHGGVRLVMIVLVFIYGARTISRNSVWKDHLTLYYNDIKHCENSFKANFLLASTLQAEIVKTWSEPKFQKRNAQYIKDADMYFQKALKIYDRYPTAWNSYGSLRYMVFRDYDHAVVCFRKAIALKPDYFVAMDNLGTTFFEKQQYDSALVWFRQAVKINPKFESAYTHLGETQLKLSDTTGFFNTQKKMKQQIPASAAPFINTGNFYLQQSDTVQAVSNWESAARLDPSNQLLLLNIANYYGKKGVQDKYQYYMSLYNRAVDQNRKKQRKG